MVSGSSLDTLGAQQRVGQFPHCGEYVGGIAGQPVYLLRFKVLLLLCVWVLWGRRLRLGISLALLLVGSIIAATAIRYYHPVSDL